MRFNLQQIYIIIDILNIAFLVLAICLALIFFMIKIFNKDCRTPLMLLASNSSLAVIVYASSMLGFSILALNNDRKQIQHQDLLCLFRGYLAYVGNGSLFYSFTLQALYRYMIIMYPTRFLWQSIKFQSFLISICWIFLILVLLPGLFTGDIAYDVGSHVCALIFQPSILLFFNMTFTFLIPMSIIMLIYLKLVRYIHQISLRVIKIQKICRIRRELVMIRRIFLLILFLIIIGIPYSAFAFLSIFTSPPIYHYRISIFFIDFGQIFVMIAIFRFSQSINNTQQKF